MRARKESQWESKLEVEGVGERHGVDCFRQAKDLEVSLWFSALSAL